jgi:hypothetical protein
MVLLPKFVKKNIQAFLLKLRETKQSYLQKDRVKTLAFQISSVQFGFKTDFYTQSRIKCIH